MRASFFWRVVAVVVLVVRRARVEEAARMVEVWMRRRDLRASAEAGVSWVSGVTWGGGGSTSRLETLDLVVERSGRHFGLFEELGRVVTRKSQEWRNLVCDSAIRKRDIFVCFFSSTKTGCAGGILRSMRSKQSFVYVVRCQSESQHSYAEGIPAFGCSEFLRKLPPCTLPRTGLPHLEIPDACRDTHSEAATERRLSAEPSFAQTPITFPSRPSSGQRPGDADLMSGRSCRAETPVQL